VETYQTEVQKIKNESKQKEFFIQRKKIAIFSVDIFYLGVF
jgi:hypothetical protein